MTVACNPHKGESSTADFPDFTYRTYEKMLIELRSRYSVGTCGQVMQDFHSGNAGTGRMMLRHDVDFSPLAAVKMARMETELGLHATYFIGFELYYNPAWEDNLRAIRRLVELDHEIGLHYDASCYPREQAMREEWLKADMRRLSDLSGYRVRSAVMHNPSIQGEDPFAESGIALNPSASAFLQDAIYISDSTRAWRDDRIIRMLDSSIDADWFMLNLHPVLWSDVVEEDRLKYLKEHVAGHYEEQIEHMLQKACSGWSGHHGGRLHDERCGIVREKIDGK